MEDFRLKRNREYTKMCIQCLDNKKVYRESNKCPHKKDKYLCRECNGSGICEHNEVRSRCFNCKGSQICEHNKRKSACKICKGSEICEHEKQKRTCKICNPISHLSIKMKTLIRKVISKEEDGLNIEKYWGCTVEEYRDYLLKLLTEDMSWDNFGTLWDIEYRLPMEHDNPTKEEKIARLHYSNTQPTMKRK
jgi:hypothetical protein